MPGADLRRQSQDDLRDHLPGLEPEREVTDWGRSERAARALDRALLEFLYSRWFRVQVAGVENVPATGGALLVSDGTGSLVYDAAMIARAVTREHPRGRAVHLATDRHFSGVPGLGMLMAKLGAVSAHPENLHRLLWDEGELVLLFAAEASAFRDAAARAQAPVIAVEVRRGPPILPMAGRLPPRWFAPPAPTTITFAAPVEPGRLPAGI